MQFIRRLEVVHHVQSNLLGPADPLFRILSGRLKFTVRRQNFNKHSFLLTGAYRAAPSAPRRSTPAGKMGYIQNRTQAKLGIRILKSRAPNPDNLHLKTKTPLCRGACRRVSDRVPPLGLCLRPRQRRMDCRGAQP